MSVSRRKLSTQCLEFIVIELGQYDNEGDMAQNVQWWQ